MSNLVKHPSGEIYNTLNTLRNMGFFVVIKFLCEQTITCSKSTKEAPEKGVKYVQRC